MPPNEEPKSPRSAIRVLAADDDPTMLRAIRRLLEAQGFEVVTTENGRAALDAIAETGPDVVITDVMMPEMDGLELCATIKSDPTTRLTPVVVVTGLNQTEDRIRGIEAGADDFLAKPFDAHELTARVRSLARMKRYTDELERAETVLFALARAIEGRDEYTEGHCERLALMGSRLGERLGLPEEDVDALRQGGILHDLGKVAVPDRILNKPGKLTDEEWELMRRHPVDGERICKGMKSFERVLPIIRHHHEKADGSGYPDGLGGEEIPVVARVMQAVDVYDALATERSYKPPMPPGDAIEVLRREADMGWWDPEIVGQFEEMVLNDEAGGSNA